MPRLTNPFLAKLGNALARDYWPDAERYVRWLRRPLPVLVLAAMSSALCGLFLHPRGFVLACGLAAVLAIGVAWPWLSLRGLSGTLSFGRTRVREGEPVATHLAVRNRLPWGAWGLAVRGAVVERADEGGAAGATPGLAHAAGWRTTEARWDLVPACRGVYPEHSPGIASAFPFGLREVSRPLGVPVRLLVWPRTFPVGPVPEAARGSEGDGLAPRTKAGTAGDPMGVRPYRRGDSLRRVHWPQTARHGHLVVCELHSLAVARVQVVLDSHHRSHVGSGPDGSLEWSIRVAASFAEGWIGQGAEVEVVLGGQFVPMSAGPVRARQAQVLDALARLGPIDNPPLGDVLGGPACRRSAGGLRIVVTTDLGLRGLAESAGDRAGDRFVVLRAAAFGGVPLEPRALPFRPWIWIDDRERVPQIVHRGWKEVTIDR